MGNMVPELSGGTLDPPEPEEGMEDFSRPSRAWYNDIMDKLGKWTIGSEVSPSENENFEILQNLIFRVPPIKN